MATITNKRLAGATCLAKVGHSPSLTTPHTQARSHLVTLQHSAPEHAAHLHTPTHSYCIYIDLYKSMLIHTHLRTSTGFYVHLYSIQTYTDLYTYPHTFIYVYTDLYWSTQMHTHTRASTHIYVNTVYANLSCTHLRTSVQIYANIRTNTPANTHLCMSMHDYTLKDLLH